MSLTEVALLIVTFGAIALGVWVLLPRNKDYFTRMGQIPLQEDPDSQGNQRD